MDDPRLRPVLNSFAAVQGAVQKIHPLAGAGGFSGSELWRVVAQTGDYCLRRWPVETSAERLAFIHAYQRHLRASGLPFIPVLIETSNGGTFVEHEGHVWELVTWMPGRADYHQYSSLDLLEPAMRALARIHYASAQMPGQSRVGTSPGLAARLVQLRELRSGGIERLEASVARRPLVWHQFARQICERFRQLESQVEQSLTDAAMISGPLFPCLRDIWHDHVLFTGDQVTGIIDFGAARVESPAGDIARLVGSLVGNYADGWRAALWAYQDTMPISAAQHELIRVFDISGVLLSGINWLTWLYLEGRQFADAEAVTRRMQQIVVRLDPPLR